MPETLNLYNFWRMKMCKDTVCDLVKNDIIAKNVEMSEKYYWVYEQVNSEIDLLVLFLHQSIYICIRN